MERRAVSVGKSDVRSVTLAVLLMPHLVSRSLMIQVNVQARNCVASIVRLKARVSLQMMGCFQPREATKTRKLFPPQRAGSQLVMIRQVGILHWQLGDGGEGA